MLTNCAYIGKVRYKDEVHAGEHEPIVDAVKFDKVQSQLQRNGRSGGRAVRNQYGALLRGVLRCATCNCGMTHTYSSKGSRQYRYYVCHRAQKRGWEVCPSPSIPAGEIERFVVDQIKAIGRDPIVIRETLAQARSQAERRVQDLRGERTALVAQFRNDHALLAQLATTAATMAPGLADAHDRIRNAERRMSEIDAELATLAGDLVDEVDVAAALADFDAVWECLAPREQARVIELLVEQVVYDGKVGNISITFRPTGIKTLASELAKQQEEAA